MKKRSNRKGFTLIELVVVIAIVGVLAGIIIPMIFGYIRKSRQAAANDDARNLFTNLASYATELDFKDDTSSVIDGIYYYGTAVSGANQSSALDNEISKAAGDISDKTCILVKFVNGHFPKVVVATGGASDTFYGSYPEPLSGKQEQFSTGAIKLLR